MSLNLKESVTLSNGKFDERDAAERVANGTFSGLTFDGVSYTALSADNEENAIVVLRYDTGGTKYHYWVYIYTFTNNKPQLIGFFHAGDRAAQGLYQIYGRDRMLVVELFDPQRSEGDCCSAGFLRYQFHWNGTGFDSVGKETKGRVVSNSRRPVSVFGLPIDQVDPKTK